MKRWLYVVLCLGLVLATVFPLAAIAEEAATPAYGWVVEKLATRSGPSTDFRETGTYEPESKFIRILSRAYDENDVCWIQCEVPYNGKLRRVYTGVQRFGTASSGLGVIPDETPLKEEVRVLETSGALYGPGDAYDIYEELEVEAGQLVTVVQTEDGYAQVEWKTAIQSYRAWVPEDTLAD